MVFAGCLFLAVIFPWLLGALYWAAGLATLCEAESGRLFQCIDHLLQDVGAVVCYLLENGIGKLLQLRIVLLNFLQLLLKLKGRGKMDFRSNKTILLAWS